MRCPPKVIYTHWSKHISKNATGAFEERVDFSPTTIPQEFKNCRGKKLVKLNIFWPEFFWSLYISQVLILYNLPVQVSVNYFL